ncbi:hypothetical protein HDU92_007008, partial [Lobulomyces angularis]
VEGGESIDVKSQEALDQIDSKRYRASIPPHVNKLMEIGIAFKDNSSHVVVRKLEKDESKELIEKDGFGKEIDQLKNELDEMGKKI